MKRTKGQIIQKNIHEKLVREHDDFRRLYFRGMFFNKRFESDRTIITDILETSEAVVSKYVGRGFIHEIVKWPK